MDCPTLVQSWADVRDVGPALSQRWKNAVPVIRNCIRLRMWLLELEVQVLDCVSTSQIPSKDCQIIYAEVLAFYDFFTVSYVVPCRDNVIGSR